ncbi:MAG: toll/interleukin-1 receptor domain-containing protein [Vicinamibacterales bacterium]
MFVDAAQYDALVNQRRRYSAYSIAPAVADVLREFRNAGVVEVVDYAAIVSPYLSEIARDVDVVLDHPNMPQVAATSRRLWLQFVLSPGGQFLPSRQAELDELLGKTSIAEFEGHLPLASLPVKCLPGGRTQLPVASVACGHDVFDAMTVLKIGQLLDAAVLDWQMYGPIYRQCIAQTGEFRALRSAPFVGSEPTEWYIPIPKTADLDDIWRLRESPYMALLRDQASLMSVSRFENADGALELLALRRGVHKQLAGTLLNNYTNYATSGLRSVFVEHVSGSADLGDGVNRRGTDERSTSATPRRAAASPRTGVAADAAVFISYAHQDNDSTNQQERWLERLLQHLTPLVRQHKIRVFSDANLSAGEAWQERIERHIDGARVAVLLVSSAYLASEFVRNSELPAILRSSQTAGTTIVSVVVNPCLFEEAFFLYPDPEVGPQSISLSVFQAVNSPTRPLSALSPVEQDEVLRKVALRVRELVVTHVRP